MLFKCVLASLNLALLVPSAAAQTGAPLTEGGSPPDVIDLERQYGEVRTFNARKWLTHFGLGTAESREACLSQCAADLETWLAACRGTYADFDAGESLAETSGRMACVREGRIRQEACLDPARFSECGEG